MGKSSSRAAFFADPDEKTVHDHDPEAVPANDNDNSDSDDLSHDENAGTEHYVTTGKSKLRRKENVSLGPQYRGSRISRDALDQDTEEDESDNAAGAEKDEDDDSEDGDSYDDPEDADLEADEAQANDSEIDSDNALAASDSGKLAGFTFRGSKKPLQPKGKTSRATAADFMSESDEQEDHDDDDEEEEDSGQDEDMDDGLDDLINGGAESDSDMDGSEEDSQDDDSDEGADLEGSEDDDKAEAKPKTKSTTAPADRPDVRKGQAIEQQRRAYDASLNLRIRLQKALVAANTLPLMEPESPTELAPYEAAEEAAVKLLNTISLLRDNLIPAAAARTGEKRKRNVAMSMSNDKIWDQLQKQDDEASAFRNDRLEKWSRKVQSVDVYAPRGLANRNRTLMDSLQEQLSPDPQSRLMKRTRVVRSCAPAQAASRITTSDAIYDDADFYQLLLKELVDQRTVENGSSAAGAAGPVAIPQVMLTAAKEAKMRKNVDRKASKGRKMRFTVHEKLQNFMAPEDRRGWEQPAIDRFFGTLFGNKMTLDENELVGSEDDSDVDVAGGPALFRS